MLVFYLGVGGIAVSTVLAQLLCCVIGYFYLKRRMNLFSFHKEDFYFDFHIFIENMKIALPMAFFQFSLNTLSNNEIAAYTFAYKLDSMLMQILSGFASALSTYIAQNYDQHNEKRIYQGIRSILKITLSLSFVFTLFAYFFKDYFINLFVNDNETMII